MPPLVSVCLPVFNGELYLEEAIESVRAQTFSDFELIIIDDASTDSSYQLIKTSAAKDKRIIFYRNEQNIGLFHNYNLCMSKAQGEIIKPFAQDDILYPNTIEYMVKVLKADSKLSLVCARRKWLDDFGNDITKAEGVTSADLYLPSNCIVRGQEVIQKILSSLDNFIGEPSTVAFWKKDIRQGFNPKFRQIGDLEYWLRLLKDGDFYFISEILCEYRFHKKSTSLINAKNIYHAIDFFRIARIYNKEIEKCGKSEEQFLRTVVAALGQNMIDYAAGGKVSLELMRQIQQETIEKKEKWQEEEFQLFQELSFHALIELGQITKNYEKSIISKKRIKFLENRLRDLLRSPSWRSTKHLRVARRFILTKLFKDTDEYSSMPGHKFKSYEDYLKREIRLVRRSRSWKLSRILRALELKINP